MAHSLVAPPTPPISTRTQKKSTPSLGFQKISASCRNSEQQRSLVARRDVTLGLVGAALGLTMSMGVDVRNANAAARRPPPPPPTEKKDPNVSGVMAKVLASKKRKEAMKDSMARLRERGKAINEPNSSSSSSSSESESE